jgi:restriction endonuclease S subunit
LTTVDDRINTQIKIIDNLESLKKGIIQKVFDGKWGFEDGERKFIPPTLRFKDDDGDAFPDWEEKKLGELFDFLRGSALSKSDISEYGINKCIHYGELFTIYSEKISIVMSKTNIKGCKSKKGDILMPSSDVTPAGLATASALFEDNVILGGDINVLRPKTEVDSLYMSYLINSSGKKIMRLVTGTTAKHIYNKDVKTLKVIIPVLFAEQQKIANMLSSIDKKIEAEKEVLEQYKQQKKYLLQNLFI